MPNNTASKNLEVLSTQIIEGELTEFELGSEGIGLSIHGHEIHEGSLSLNNAPINNYKVFFRTTPGLDRYFLRLLLKGKKSVRYEKRQINKTLLNGKIVPPYTCDNYKLTITEGNHKNFWLELEFNQGLI